MREELKAAENLYVLGVALLGLVVTIITDKAGMGQKWHAAIVSTSVAFGVPT
jgi:hypothetical protein